MQWTTIETNWTAYVPRLLTRWPDLNEDTLLATDGRMPEVVEHIGAVEQADTVVARDMLKEWMMGAEPADAVMDETRDNARILSTAADVSDGEDVYSDDAKFGDDNVADTPMGRN